MLRKELHDTLRHHAKDGTLDTKGLTAIAENFRTVRVRYPMTPEDIIALANHLAAHLEALKKPVPNFIQAIRTKNDSLTEKPVPVLSRFSKKSCADPDKEKA